MRFLKDHTELAVGQSLGRGFAQLHDIGEGHSFRISLYLHNDGLSEPEVLSKNEDHAAGKENYFHNANIADCLITGKRGAAVTTPVRDRCLKVA